MENKQNLTFLGKVLDEPSYLFQKDGKLVKPCARILFREFFSKLNVFKNKKNWLSAWSYFCTCSLAVFFFVFVFKYFTLPLFLVGMVYSMVILGTHGTIYLHRYSTHRAFKFTNSFSRFIVRNLVIKIIPEEVYVISHHVHHQLSEKPGDPYNVNGGGLYCFLSDVNHQSINRTLTECEYTQLTKLLNHTGMKLNTFAEYQRYGSISNPFTTIAHYLLNWAFWFAAFSLLVSVPFAFAIFGCSAIWAFGVRTYNYDGHGRGKDRRKVGSDFNQKDWSVNQWWPGFVAGEWHNNHHLYPNGARSGFLPHQPDLAWEFIRFYHFIGGISSYKCYREEFLEKHYRPYLASLNEAKLPLKS